MLTHIIQFETEINGKKYKFLIENGSETPDCKKALFQFVGELDKLEFDHKQKEVVEVLEQPEEEVKF